jgi:hypothetical protein
VGKNGFSPHAGCWDIPKLLVNEEPMANKRKTGKSKIMGLTSMPRNIGFSVAPISTVSEDDLFPSLEIEEGVYNKVQYWIDKTDVEVSGLGRIIYDAERHVWRVVSAYLVEQVNSASDTELNAEAIGRLMFETKDDPGQLNWWWHSHHNMGVFWSSTDLAAIEELGEHGFFVATVFNKRRESLSCVYQNVPFRMFSNELDFEIVYTDSPIHKEWDDEFDEKVQEKVRINKLTPLLSLPQYNRERTLFEEYEDTEIEDFNGPFLPQ